MSDKRKCPHCSKKFKIEEYNLEWHKNGRVGKCPECNKKVYVTVPARGIIIDKETGVAKKRFRNA